MRFLAALLLSISAALVAAAPQGITVGQLLSDLANSDSSTGPPVSNGQTNGAPNGAQNTADQDAAADAALSDLIANGPAFIGSLASQMLSATAGAPAPTGVGSEKIIEGEIQDGKAEAFTTITVTPGQGATAPTPIAGGSGGFGSGQAGTGGGSIGTGTGGNAPPVLSTPVLSTPASLPAASSPVASANDPPSVNASPIANKTSKSIGETAIPSRTFQNVATLAGGF